MNHNGLKDLELRCRRFYEEQNKTIVFGRGRVNSKILMVGEAPGGQEIKEDRPFVGQAGKNLEQFLTILGLSREDLYITNAVKFRPTKINAKTKRENNRTPTWKEVLEGQVFLMEEIKLVSPAFIIPLGNTSLRAVTKDDKASIGELHGKIVDVEVDGEKYKMYPLYHPASIIYNHNLKQTYMEDLYGLKDVLENH